MRNLLAGLVGVGVLAFALARPAATLSVAVPPPAVDAELAASARPLRTAVLSGGCFWGVQAVFQHVKGVTEGGLGLRGRRRRTRRTTRSSAAASTGHAESVQVTYDPSQVTLRPAAAGLLLGRARSDPAEPPGPRPRHAVPLGDLLPRTPSRSRSREPTSRSSTGRSVFRQADRHRRSRRCTAFYAAEDYHQDYATLHPTIPTS